MAGFYFVAGLNHFVQPEFYLQMMPPYLPFPEALNFLSGAAESVLGLLLLFGATRRWAAWGIILLLIAIFPANLYMYQSGGAQFGVSDLALLLRLPMQFVLIWWAWLYTRRT